MRQAAFINKNNKIFGVASAAATTAADKWIMMMRRARLLRRQLILSGTPFKRDAAATPHGNREKVVNTHSNRKLLFHPVKCEEAQ